MPFHLTPVYRCPTLESRCGVSVDYDTILTQAKTCCLERYSFSRYLSGTCLPCGLLAFDGYIVHHTKNAVKYVFRGIKNADFKPFFRIRLWVVNFDTDSKTYLPDYCSTKTPTLKNYQENPTIYPLVHMLIHKIVLLIIIPNIENVSKDPPLFKPCGRPR